MSILLADKHVEHALTLLALISVASNPVEVTRYQRRLIDLQREHSELRDLTLDDPRIPARVAELETIGQDQIIEAFCAGCGIRTGKRLSSNTVPIHCHECAVKRMFAEARRK